jgi:hypothetical protein
MGDLTYGGLPEEALKFMGDGLVPLEPLIESAMEGQSPFNASTNELNINTFTSTLPQQANSTSASKLNSPSTHQEIEWNVSHDLERDHSFSVSQQQKHSPLSHQNSAMTRQDSLSTTITAMTISPPSRTSFSHSILEEEGHTTQATNQGSHFTFSPQTPMLPPSTSSMVNPQESAHTVMTLQFNRPLSNPTSSTSTSTSTASTTVATSQLASASSHATPVSISAASSAANSLPTSPALSTRTTNFRQSRHSSGDSPRRSETGEEDDHTPSEDAERSRTDDNESDQDEVSTDPNKDERDDSPPSRDEKPTNLVSSNSALLLKRSSYQLPTLSFGRLQDIKSASNSHENSPSTFTPKSPIDDLNTNSSVGDGVTLSSFSSTESGSGLSSASSTSSSLNLTPHNRFRPKMPRGLSSFSLCMVFP